MNSQGLYRFLTLLLGVLVMSFAWPLRGQFGHEWGAAITGAAAAVLALLTPSFASREAFGQAVFFGTLGFVLGGENLPYGALIDGILREASLKDCVPELLTLFFIGASWGCIGSTYLGLGLSEKAVLKRDYAVLSFAGIACAALTFFLSETFQVMLILTGLILFLHTYNAWRIKSRTLAVLGLSGLVSFGAGFAGAVMILFWGNKGFLPGPENWWTLRDQMWGAAGGLGIVLALWFCFSRGFKPRVLCGVKFQRFCYVLFIPGICGVNTWDVYEKWFKSSPITAHPEAAALTLLFGMMLLIGFFIFYLRINPAVFSQPFLNKLILTGTSFFFLYLAFFAIAKSIFYSGWSVWELGFSLFLLDLVILIPALFFVLTKTPSPRPA